MKTFLVLCGLMASVLHWHAQAATGPAPSGQPGPSRLEELRPLLVTAEETGVRYVKDDLTERSLYPVPLLVHTTLTDPANCGRRAGGWTVKGGIADAYTYAVLRDLPVLGNRSQLAQLSFRSTQTGVAHGAHGLVEMRLCRGTTSDDLPLRIRVRRHSQWLSVYEHLSGGGTRERAMRGYSALGDTDIQRLCQDLIDLSRDGRCPPRTVLCSSPGADR